MQSRAAIVGLALTALALGCGPTGDEAARRRGEGAAWDPETTTAVMRDSAGRELGTLSLIEARHGIVVLGKLTGLPPGEHGLHIHAIGRCAPTFDAAGGHWNPLDKQHGLDNPAGPHLGDLLNLSVAEDGTVTVNSTTQGGSFKGEHPLLDGDGSAVMIHAGPDDHRTDPSGDSGGRIACGVVGGG